MKFYKYCPICEEHFPNTFIFCPFCGELLSRGVEQPDSGSDE